ncbi:uncharacterized protein LOC135813910 [Sycon ciliatum]|uniref:uncharacterized protein LOC135813910 n=1 Tax=Sycon ciliatum TaxID=27933 RepID=UPI0031F6BF27
MGDKCSEVEGGRTSVATSLPSAPRAIPRPSSSSSSSSSSASSRPASMSMLRATSVAIPRSSSPIPASIRQQQAVQAALGTFHSTDQLAPSDDEGDTTSNKLPPRVLARCRPVPYNPQRPQRQSLRTTKSGSRSPPRAPGRPSSPHVNPITGRPMTSPTPQPLGRPVPKSAKKLKQTGSQNSISTPARPPQPPAPTIVLHTPSTSSQSLSSQEECESPSLDVAAELLSPSSAYMKPARRSSQSRTAAKSSALQSAAPAYEPERASNDQLPQTQPEDARSEEELEFKPKPPPGPPPARGRLRRSEGRVDSPSKSLPTSSLLENFGERLLQQEKNGMRRSEFASDALHLEVTSPEDNAREDSTESRAPQDKMRNARSLSSLVRGTGCMTIGSSKTEEQEDEQEESGQVDISLADVIGYQTEDSQYDGPHPPPASPSNIVEWLNFGVGRVSPGIPGEPDYTSLGIQSRGKGSNPLARAALLRATRLSATAYGTLHPDHDTSSALDMGVDIRSAQSVPEDLNRENDSSDSEILDTLGLPAVTYHSKMLPGRDAVSRLPPIGEIQSLPNSPARGRARAGLRGSKLLNTPSQSQHRTSQQSTRRHVQPLGGYAMKRTSGSSADTPRPILMRGARKSVSAPNIDALAQRLARNGLPLTVGNAELDYGPTTTQSNPNVDVLGGSRDSLPAINSSVRRGRKKAANILPPIARNGSEASKRHQP